MEVRVERNPEFQCGQQCENLHTHQASINQLPEAECKQFDSGQLEQQNENITGKGRTPNIIILISNCINKQAKSINFDAPGGPSDVPQVKDSRNAANDEHNVLRHSDSSAFSK